MATQEETKREVVECLNRLGRESKMTFNEFEIEAHTQGKYRAGVWTYKLARQRVSLEYWFSAFSSKREEADLTFSADDDLKKIEDDLRNCLNKVRDAVKRKKGMF